MKKTNLILLLSVIAFFSISCRHQQERVISATEAMNQVMAFEAKFNAAHKEKNITVCEKMLAGEFELVNPNGKRIGRDKVIKEDLVRGQPVFDDFVYNTAACTDPSYPRYRLSTAHHLSNLKKFCHEIQIGSPLWNFIRIDCNSLYTA